MTSPEPHVAASVLDANRALELTLPLADREDFEDAQRGFVGALSPGVVEGTDGRVVWDAGGLRLPRGRVPGDA